MRIKNPALLRELHYRWRECALCGEVEPLSLHHISKHPRDDVEPNLVMLCGSGTTGCHGQVEARDAKTLRILGRHLRKYRQDTLSYLDQQFPVEGAAHWLERTFDSSRFR